MSQPTFRGFLPDGSMPAAALAEVESARDIAVTASDAAVAAAALAEDISHIDTPDSLVATLVADSASAARANLDTWAEIRVHTDLLAISLQAAIDATPTGGTLSVRRTWAITATVAINRAMTVQFDGGSISYANTALAAICVTADGVGLNNPLITGPGPHADSGSGIRVERPAGQTANVKSFTILGGNIRNIPHSAVWLDHVTGVSLTGTEIANVGYGGVICLSCDAVTMTSVRVETVTMPAPWVNAYGIALTRGSGSDLVAHPRTRSVTLIGCTVTGIPTWEGIDSHGGDTISIIGCHVYDCKVGIAMVPAGGFGPRNIHVSGCVVDSLSDTGAQSGIKVVGTATDPATGTVTGNTVRRHGEVGGDESGIQAYDTDALHIGHNIIAEAGNAGILLKHANRNVTVDGNVISDTWGEATATAIMIRGADNTAALSGNRVARGGRQATVVNTRGVAAIVATGNRLTDMGGNDMRAATTPWTVQAINIIVQGFYGASGASKPAVSGSVAGNAALSSLLAALASQGLITNSTST